MKLEGEEWQPSNVVCQVNRPNLGPLHPRQRFQGSPCSSLSQYGLVRNKDPAACMSGGNMR